MVIKGCYYHKKRDRLIISPDDNTHAINEVLLKKKKSEPESEQASNPNDQYARKISD